MVKTVKYNSIEMKYGVFGEGKKSFVIIPGLSATPVTDSIGAIEKMYASFTSDYTIYIFDRRSNLPSEYSIHEMAEDTYAVLQHIGVEKAFVYGVSQGGMIALDLAISHPGFADKLIIASSTDKFSAEKDSIIKNWISLAEKHDGKGLFVAFAKGIYSPDKFETVKNVFSMLGEQITEKQLDDFAVLARAILSFDLSDRISEIKAPTLAVSDKGDVIMGIEPAKRIAEATGGEYYVYTEGYGHAVYDEAPDFSRRIFEFLQK